MHPLAQKIDALRRQLLWRRRATAACWVLAAGVGATFVLGLADYWIHFQDTGLRIMATAAFVLVVAWVAYRWWYVPSRVRLRTLDVARRVESRFPQLHDALASAVEFLNQSEDDYLAGSAQLRRLVVARAQNEVEALPLGDVIDDRPLRRAATVCGIGVVLALACLLVDSSAVRTAVTRLFAPLGPAQWPRQHRLAFRHLPSRVAAGDSLEIEVIDQAGRPPEDTRLEFATLRNGDRDVTNEPLVRTGDTLIARKENIQRSFGLCAHGGDDDTMPWQWVEVVDSPRLESLELKVHPPKYSGLPVTASQRQLNVLVGSGIEVSGMTTKPIRAARILPEGSDSVAATLASTPTGEPDRSFHVSADQWIAHKTGLYRIELTDDNGVTSTVGRGNLTVEPDTPPSVSWRYPTGTIYVLPSAAVPIAVQVQDNLAIRDVKLVYERNDRSESERRNYPTEPAIEIYHAPEQAIVHQKDGSTHAENRLAEYTWDLTSLKVPPGAQLTVNAEAQDFRPGTGRTASPLQIFVVSRERLESRLTERQSQIVRQLERALTLQQSIRDDVRRLEIEQHDVGNLAKSSQAMLRGAEVNQRRVGQILADPTDGAISIVRAILDELAMNRFANSSLGESMKAVEAELQRLADSPLSTADRCLTVVRKTLESAQPTNKQSVASQDNQPQFDAKTQANIHTALSATSTAQDEVVPSLERLIAELSGKADYRRIVRLLTELRQDQIEHEKNARADIGLGTVSLQLSELSRTQRASLNSTAASEMAIAERFAKIEQSLTQLAQQMNNETDPMAITVGDVADLARQLNIGADMRQSADDLKENRVSQALDREVAIAAHLLRLLNTLRNETPREPQQLADKLRAAEQQLETARRNTAELRQQIVNAENKPANPSEQQRLAAQQKSTRQSIEKLSRELDRLQAKDASQSSQDAAKKLDNTNPRKPSSSQQVQQAEKSLEQAAQQLAQQRQQAEDDFALEFVRRFQAALTQMVARQQRVLQKTIEMNAARAAPKQFSEEQQEHVLELANAERQLSDQAKDHRELLFGLEAVRLGLEEAERRLQAAAKLLDTRDTGTATQNAEELALDRLDGMLQVFAQTASEATPKPNAPPQNPAPANPQQQAQQPQRRPTFELLQVKMLRMLQADLNSRTHQLQEHLASAKPAEAAALRKEAQDLSTEQGQLAKLVESLLRSDNEEKPLK